MIIGERLKGLLKYYRISAKEFAKMINVTEGMVYKYYKMENVDYKTLSNWSEAINVPISTFTDDYEYRLKTHQLTNEEKSKSINFIGGIISGKGNKQIQNVGGYILSDVTEHPQETVQKINELETQLALLTKDLEIANNENEHLKKQLEEKERIIQILLNKN